MSSNPFEGPGGFTREHDMRSGSGFRYSRPDFWSDEVILNPYGHYDALRSLGPAVCCHTTRHGADPL